MDRTAMEKKYQLSNSKQVEVNAKLFHIIRKSNISKREKVKKVRKLLAKNPQPDIDAQDGNDNCNTALHVAIKRNELEVVNFLLSQGADTAIENGDGKTSLNLAEELNNVEIIDALKRFTSQVEWPPSYTDILASHTSQPVEANPNQVSVFHSTPHVAASGKQTASTVLPPFSDELKVDKKLNLSHDDFKTTMKEFYANKQLSASDQLRTTPPYPTPHVLAQFAKMVYPDSKLGKPEGWLLLTTASHFGINNGYFGTAYWHPEHQQVVIAHRGTDIKNIGALVADIKGVLFNNYVEQMSSASTFANKVVTVLREIEQERMVSFEIFFTGHSLGGWLAQITAFTTEYLEVKGGIFLKGLTREEHEPTASSTVHVGHDIRQSRLAQITAFFTKGFRVTSEFFKKVKTEQDEPLTSSTVQDSHDVRQSYHPHTVVFDSPGCKDMLSQMADNLDIRYKGRFIDLQQLDITSYLSAPNRINTCNSHLGTVYRIFTDLSDMGFLGKHTPLYNLATHSMDKIVQAFDNETGQVYRDDEGRLKIREVVDWPVSAGLMGGAELNEFFKWAEHLNNYHPEVMDTVPSKVPKGYHHLRYQTKAYDECTKSLSAFTQDEREFLERYRWLRHVPEFFKPDDLFSEINKAQAEEQAEQNLPNFELGNESVRCPDPDADASKLHKLIPYVKRLVRLFPLVKENVKLKLSSVQIRKTVYKHETQRYVGKICQSPLDFNSGALHLKEFLTNDQQVWHLRMVDEDAWSGMTKVYQVLKQISCEPNYSCDDHYTILKLKRLLTVNQLINVRELMASMETHHLLMISFGTNQTVNDELRDMFIELFSILKQKNTMKIILTTQSENNTAAFLQEIATETHVEGFITTDEQSTWSDLTDISQRNMLEKTVIFQGRRVALKQLTSAESAKYFFPLSDLLKKKELRIGKEPVLSADSGYNEKYFIDRTFNHNIVIREDMLNGGKLGDLLASTEEEFKQLCQQNPNKNVHFMEKEKSGELIWQQSQGNFKALREHIDTLKTHSYAPRDFDKLLQQAKKYRIMLIADRAGMGKSTILTHLYERIKQESPANWLVRIDLNDYTEIFKVQNGKKVDEVKVLEFILKEVLKLESDLEKELFKKSFEGNEVNKVVVMVDGVDEICPNYKELVIDMLQVLKQTSLEQLWVTTRPHLRDELEDNLQRLSYNLQPFSEVEQVEFLKKFWFQNSNLEDKDEHRIQIYATALLRKLAQSISDKDRKFTGIPLQTRMLAEAFEEDFRSFYLSGKSEPDLTHKLDLLGLYGRFIESKYEIYFSEKSKTPADNVAAGERRERDFRCLQLEHQLLALEALFTEEQVTFLQSYNHSKFADEALARIGIAQRNEEGKPHFIHRTFAEYFVADFLINELTKKTKQHVHVKDILLNEVLRRKDCNVIRAFLDGRLENSKPPNKALKEYGVLLDEQWNQGEVNETLVVDTTALHIAATEDNFRIIGFLVDSLKSGENSDTQEKMILARYKGKTAWHMVAENGGLQALEKIWEGAEVVKLTHTYSLLLTQVFGEKTAVKLAAEGVHIKEVEELWSWAKAQINPSEIRNKLLLEQDLEGRTAWHGAAQRGRVEVLVKMWDWAKELQLKPDELRYEVCFSKDKHGQTVWIMAAEAGHVELLEKLWDWAKELQLKPEELMNEVVLSNDTYGSTSWHEAAFGGHVEVLQKMWGWAKTLQLKPEELWDKVWLKKNRNGLTPWHTAAERSHVDVLEKVWEWATELQLNPEEISDKVLLSKSEDGETAWHKAAIKGHVEVLQKLWDWAKELQLKPDELMNQVWLSKGKNGQTAWLMAAEERHIKVLEKLWDWAIELQLKPEDLKEELCLSIECFRNTTSKMAADTGNVQLLEKLWDWAKELQLKPEELRNKVWVSKQWFGKMYWFRAAEEGRVEVLKKLWNWVKELQIQPENLREEVLFAEDSGSWAWHMAAEGGHIEVLRKLWDWAKELQLKPDELRNQVWFSKNEYWETAWLIAARGSYVEVLEKLWDWAEELQLKPEDLKDEVWLSKDRSGETAWFMAVRNHQVEVLEKLWDLAKQLQLKPEVVMDHVWLSKDNKGRTAWYIAASLNHIRILDKLWDWAKELKVKTEKFRDEVFKSIVYIGEMDRHHTGQIELLEKLWNWIKEFQLKPEELKNRVWVPYGWFGDTAWHMAVENCRVDILIKLWHFVQELQLKPEELMDELFFVAINGQTVWHKAAIRGHVEVLEKLWDWVEELQLKPEELRNEVLLSKDAWGETAWHMAARHGHVEVLRKLWDWAKKLQLKPEELRDEVWLSQDSDGRTAWLLAAGRGHVEVLENLWDWAKELQLKPEEFRNGVCVSKEWIGKTAWHMAARHGQVEILMQLWNFVKELQLKPEELMDEVWLSRDQYGQTAWHLAAGEGHVELLEKLWDWAKELKLKPEELWNKVCLSTDKSGETAWLIAAKGNHDKALRKLWDCAKELQLKRE